MMRAGVGLLLLLGACSSDPAGSADPQPECKWPVGAAASGECSGTRAYLMCTDPAGGGWGCPSNSVTGSCETDGGPTVSGGPWTCKDLCAPDEYTPSCEGDASPPSTCRVVARFPEGEVLCCPCGA